jgi:hypothetical protein
MSLVLGVGDSRYSFVQQHLQSATLFIRRLREIESVTDQSSDDEVRCEHKGLVCAVIFQCAAALECESHELCVHGPGSWLGSNGTDFEALGRLRPFEKIIDKQPTVERFQMILRLLDKPILEEGREPFQSTSKAIKLRNELVHFKSKPGKELKRDKFLSDLETLRHNPPPFTNPLMNFFPHRCLSADCATWVLRSVVAFLEAVYDHLGVISRFETYRNLLTP